MLEVARNILPAGIDCVYIRQAEALGLGHAVHCAKPVIGDEPFAVILADDMINPKGTTTCLKQMVDVYNYHHTTIVGVEPVPEENIGRYGVVSGSESSDGIIEMNGIVEKPAAKDAPSNLGVVGRYILTPAIFEHIERLGKGWEALLNKRGTTWRNLSEEEKTDIDATKAGQLMCKQPALIKRPVLADSDQDEIQVGFSTEAYHRFLKD